MAPGPPRRGRRRRRDDADRRGASARVPTVLVPIPAGRLNHCARRLGIASPADAAAAAARGAALNVALGVLRSEGTERVFLNTAVVGAYPNVIRLRERMRPYLST